MLLISAAVAGAADAPRDDGPLAALALEPDGVTVSGVSSGGAMAVQFHTAHSRLVRGAGVLAAPPYFCAENSIGLALGRCMKGGESIPVEHLLQRAHELAEAGAIDPLDGLDGDRVWLYRGAADPHVHVTVADALERYYVAQVGAQNVQRVERPGAAHNFPVAAAGLSACDRSDPPYVASCGFDAAPTLLQHLYGPMRARTDSTPLEPLLSFDQRPYAQGTGSAALADRGWLYVPAACTRAGAEKCRLHVVFHGCRQGGPQAGEAFVRQSGYLETADANRIVLLFPQVQPSMQPLNPLGCWDWWGYEGADYATRDGRQVAAVRRMVGALLGEPSTGDGDARSP